MKSIKVFWFDIKNGFIRNWGLYICSLIIVIIAFIDLTNKIRGFKVFDILKDSSTGYGDYWFYLYGGMREYIPSPGNPFIFPIIWITVFVTIPFIILNYPFRDMQSHGQQVLVWSRSRSMWWLSKCIWNILCTVVYHLIIASIIALLCLFLKLPISSGINEELMRNY